MPKWWWCFFVFFFKAFFVHKSFQGVPIIVEDTVYRTVTHSLFGLTNLVGLIAQTTINIKHKHINLTPHRPDQAVTKDPVKVQAHQCALSSPCKLQI